MSASAIAASLNDRPFGRKYIHLSDWFRGAQELGDRPCAPALVGQGHDHRKAAAGYTDPDASNTVMRLGISEFRGLARSSLTWLSAQ